MRTPQLKVQPQNIDAEKAVLCACLVNKTIIPLVQGILSPEDFYFEAHQFIAEAIYSLGHADVVTLEEKLKVMGKIEMVGGMPYLAELLDFVSTSAGWKHHAEIVKEMSQRRQVIFMCGMASERAFSLHEPLEDGISDLKGAITNIEREQAPEIESSRSIVNRVFKEIEERCESGYQYVGIRTGLDNIDHNLYGLEPGSTTYLIARPSMGKTALSLTIADHVAETQGPVLYFSLESNSDALTRRRMAARSNIFLSRIRTANIGNQWDRLTEACSQIIDIPLMVIDKSRYKSPAAMLSLAQSVKLTKGLKLIVVDHVGLMRAPGARSDYESSGICSSAVQDMAKACGSPVLALCQLNRAIEQRVTKMGSSKYPQLYDMRDSGKYEENADNVWGLWREDKESPHVRLEQLKGRDSGTWTTWLHFDRMVQRYKDGEAPTERLPYKAKEEDLD